MSGHSAVRGEEEHTPERPVSEPQTSEPAGGLFALQRHMGNRAMTAWLQPHSQAVVARNNPDTEALSVQGARELLQPGYEALLRDMSQPGADGTGFGDYLAEHAIDTLPGLADDQADRIEARGLAVGELTDEAEGTTYDIPTALQTLAGIHDQAAAVPGLQVSLGVAALARALARSAADYVAGGLAPPLTGPDAAVGEVWARLPLLYQLHVAVEAITDPLRLLELELEGTIDELIRLRREFSYTELEQAQRAAIGEQIGVAARRVMLIDEAVTALEQLREEGAEEPPLEEALIEVAGEIAAIRETAGSEHETQQFLGDQPELLAQQLVDMEDPNLVEPGTYGIDPEEAFPEATDAASNRWMSDLADRLREQQADVSELRGKVIPATPTYTLDEFAQVFRRWYSLFSHAQEEQDPILQMWLQLVGDVWDMAGRDLGDPLVAVEGGIARAWLMNFAAGYISRSMGGPSAQFARDLGAAGEFRQEPEVGGSASAPEYEYAELYPDAARTHPLSAEGERQSREARGDLRQSRTATRFTGLSFLPAGEQPAEAERLGITRGPQVPFVAARRSGGPSSPVAGLPGLRSVTAQEGWSYLIDVTDPEQTLVSREHKVLPPEVVDYMLARRQQLGTLQQPHRPRANGQLLGERAIRSGGVEAGEGTATARYRGGKTDPELSSSAADLRRALRDAREAAGVIPERADPSQVIVGRLLGELQGYLDTYFATRTDMGYRLGSVLVIGEVEWGFASQVVGLLDPEVIRQIATEALKLAATMATLSALGPLGRIAARAYQAYLSAQGVSDVAAMIGVISFCRNAADAEGLDQARAWARLGRPVADDIGELFETLIGTPISGGIEIAAGTRPNSARELADACRPLMENPESRQMLIDSLDARIRELQEAGGMLRTDDSELAALQAFRDELLGAEAPFAAPDPAAGDIELPGRQAEQTEAELFFEAPRTRSREERATLEAELGDLASEVRVVEDSTLRGTTVQVRYDGDQLRMHIGAAVEAEHVRWHVETARQMLRYKGVLGQIRALLERIGSLLRISAGYGTAGWEARLEVSKLNAIVEELEARKAAIEARAERMSGDPRAAQAEARAIQQEIAGYERQLREYEEQVDDFEAGRGFVAALDPTVALTRAQRFVDGNADLKAKFDATPASLDALTELFARAGSGSASATPRAGRYIPVHTRASPSELRTVLDYAGRSEVKKISLVPSSSAGRSPDMLVEIEEPDGTVRVERVEITTVTGANRGYQARGAGGGRAAAVDDIVGRVRSKALPSSGVSQLVAPLPGNVPTGGTIVVHVLRSSQDPDGDVRTAMARLAQDLQGAPHVNAIEFDLRGAGSLRFERQPNGTYLEV